MCQVSKYFKLMCSLYLELAWQGAVTVQLYETKEAETNTEMGWNGSLHEFSFTVGCSLDQQIARFHQQSINVILNAF